MTHHKAVAFILRLWNRASCGLCSLACLRRCVSLLVMMYEAVEVLVAMEKCP